MSLVGNVGKKRLRARVAMLVVYLCLSLGALTTVFPFLLMVSTGLKGPTDQNDSNLIPAYFGDDSQLLAKYLDDKYWGDKSQIASTRISGGDVSKYERFLMQLPIDYWVSGFRTPTNGVTSRMTERYRTWLRAKFATIDDLNRAYIEENLAFQTIIPPNELLDKPNWKPSGGRKWDDWLAFKAQLPAEFRIPIRTQRLWQQFLEAKFKKQLASVPPELINGAKSFEELQVPGAHPLLNEFKSKMPPRFRERSSEEIWATIGSGPLPIADYEKSLLKKSDFASQTRNEFATRNLRYVVDYVALNGRALWNTLIFCVLAIVTQLTVNPMAAYALSRFPMPSTGKILLFLLATMAFPAEVAMIPSFLLLKDLHLLNTFAALVLPSAASGYMIFLLKGFFDSLPQELFESGQIDGAKESKMMMRIAFPLSRPVLGYLALLAFMGAYGAFMYAFLVAQDQKVWTLMVWIYQMQLTAPKAVIMAALTLAALPTLLVFLLAQRVILRGIVIPGDK